MEKAATTKKNIESVNKETTVNAIYFNEYPALLPEETADTLTRYFEIIAFYFIDMSFLELFGTGRGNPLFTEIKDSRIEILLTPGTYFLTRESKYTKKMPIPIGNSIYIDNSFKDWEKLKTRPKGFSSFKKTDYYYHRFEYGFKIKGVQDSNKITLKEIIIKVNEKIELVNARLQLSDLKYIIADFQYNCTHDFTEFQFLFIDRTPYLIRKPKVITSRNAKKIVRKNPIVNFIEKYPIYLSLPEKKVLTDYFSHIESYIVNDLSGKIHTNSTRHYDQLIKWQKIKDKRIKLTLSASTNFSKIIKDNKAPLCKIGNIKNVNNFNVWSTYDVTKQRLLYINGIRYYYHSFVYEITIALLFSEKEVIDNLEKEILNKISIVNQLMESSDKTNYRIADFKLNKNDRWNNVNFFTLRLLFIDPTPFSLREPRKKLKPPSFQEK